MTGRLVLVSTPIGNLGDISIRALETLRAADVIACEDTRRTRKLLTHFEITGKKLIASHEHNEAMSAQGIVQLIEGGATVAFVSDSGTPGISDPGQRVVTAVVEASLEVSSIPGASAVLAAVVVSGFDTKRFCFEGFLPRSGADRKQRLAVIADETRTTVLYEAPGRISKTCADLAASNPDRQVALVREMTKLHEEVVRCTLSELAERASESELKGECVLILEGAASAKAFNTDDELRSLLELERSAGASTKEAVAKVARITGISRNRIYELAVSK